MPLRHAPCELRDVELEVLGWRTEDGEIALNCGLIDGSAGTIPARWTDLPRCTQEPPLGVLASPAAWRLLGERLEGLRESHPRWREPSAETEEAQMSGQLAVAMSEQRMVAAAVWETLAPRCQQQVTI